MLIIPLTQSFNAVRSVYADYLSHAPLAQALVNKYVESGWKLCATVETDPVTLGWGGASGTSVSEERLNASGISSAIKVDINSDTELIAELFNGLNAWSTWILVEAILIEPSDHWLTKFSDFQVGPLPRGAAITMRLGYAARMVSNLFKDLVKYLPVMPFFVLDADPPTDSITEAWLAAHVVKFGFNICDGEAYLWFSK